MKCLSSLILLTLLLWAANGCVSSKPSPRTGNESVSEQLAKLRKWMKSDEVKMLLGLPDTTKPTTTAKGAGEQWIYSEATLVKNINGPEAVAGFAYMQKIARRAERVIVLDFENGILVTEGL